jgi:hypothetical protein
LLLASAILVPPADAAADSVTVPCTVAPAAMLDELSAIPDIASVVACVGEFELPH